MLLSRCQTVGLISNFRRFASLWTRRFILSLLVRTPYRGVLVFDLEFFRCPGRATAIPMHYLYECRHNATRQSRL